MKTRIYLDVDGVLNATHAHVGWRTPEETPEDAFARMSDRIGLSSDIAYIWHDDNGVKREAGDAEWRFHYPAPFRIRWSPRLVEALNALGDAVELVWLTTWRQDAQDSIQPLLGISLPLDGVTTFPSIEWKRDAVLAEQAESPSPFVWIDDELDHLPRASVSELVGKGLMISPHPQRGILPLNMQIIQEYVGRQHAD